LLRIISEGGWRGPIGLLNHTDEDAEVRLKENLRGLQELTRQLEVQKKGASLETPSSKYWAIEDAAEREKLPLYQVIPAAKPIELTPANGCPKRETLRTWHRSHGDNGRS